MRTVRVFPRRTKATPTDALAFIGEPPMIGLPDGIDRVHVSVTFTWDLQEAERLARLWSRIAPTEIGGPATGQRGGIFSPGEYLRNGYTITSRGCPNRCDWCDVWRRDGTVRELPVRDGWNVLDDNLLATSDAHFEAVIEMVGRQNHRPQFTGGIDARLLTGFHAKLLRSIRPEQMFFACDSEAAFDPLEHAAEILFDAGWWAGHKALRCYVLIGRDGDSLADAEVRLRRVWDLGFLPMAMLWRDERGRALEGWARFQRLWARPALIRALLKGPSIEAGTTLVAAKDIIRRVAK